MPTTYKPPVITDFGAARLGLPGQKYTGDVMPGVFRAPEVIAGMEWDSQIDIWSVGVMVRSLFESTGPIANLMDGKDLESIGGRQPLPPGEGRPSQRRVTLCSDGVTDGTSSQAILATEHPL